MGDPKENPTRLGFDLAIFRGMKFRTFLSLILILIATPTRADVNFVNGAFQYQIGMDQIEPQQVLRYNSRRARISPYGMGWCLEEQHRSGCVDSSLKLSLQILQGNLSEIKVQDQVWRFQYDDLHNLTQIQDPHGEITRITYDKNLDRVRAVYTPDACVETFQYREGRHELRLQALRRCPQTPPDRMEFQVRWYGPEFDSRIQSMAWRSAQKIGQLTYDPQGRLLRQTTRTETISYQYNKEGQIQSVAQRSLTTSALAEEYQFHYDLRQRLKKIESLQPDHRHSIEFIYDFSGRLQSLKNETLADAALLRAALEKLAPIEGGLTL